MKTISCALVTLVTLSALTYAQTRPTGPTGTWQAEGLPWTVTLTVDGPTLTGTVSQAGAPGTEISDGRIDGSTLTFKVKIPNGRTITFAGKITDDEIAFTRDVQVPEGADPGGAGMLGANGPREFTVSRVVAGSAWSGTIRNAPSPRNANPNPNPRAVSLGTKKVTTPHWRWRGGDKQIEVRTFTLPMGSFELNVFQLEGDRLAFSYSRPAAGDEVRCQLTRQPEGRFTGSCQADGGGFSVLIDLTPPAPAQK